MPARNKKTGPKAPRRRFGLTAAQKEDHRQLAIQREFAAQRYEEPAPIALWIRSIRGTMSFDEVLACGSLSVPHMMYACFPGITAVQRRKLIKFCKPSPSCSDFEDCGT